MTMTTTLTGKMLIGAAAVAGTDGGHCAFNPATNADIAEPRFGFGTAADVDRAATLAREVDGLKSVTNNLSVR